MDRLGSFFLISTFVDITRCINSKVDSSQARTHAELAWRNFGSLASVSDFSKILRWNFAAYELFRINKSKDLETCVERGK